jgi:hypothetical protein
MPVPDCELPIVGAVLAANSCRLVAAGSTDYCTLDTRHSTVADRGGAARTTACVPDDWLFPTHSGNPRPRMGSSEAVFWYSIWEPRPVIINGLCTTP